MKKTVMPQIATSTAKGLVTAVRPVAAPAITQQTAPTFVDDSALDGESLSGSGLTEKQSIFVEVIANEYLNPTAAARIAGYAVPSRAAEILKNDPKVLAAISRRRKALEREFAVSKEEVVSILRDATRMARLQSDPQTMVNAARELGRMHGLYEPSRVQVSADHNHRHTLTIEKIATLPDSALLEYIEGDIIDIAQEDYSNDRSD